MTTIQIDKPAAPPRVLGVPTAVSADLLELPSPRVSALMLSLVGGIAAFIVWAALASITEVTSGRGRVIPASKIQVVQNLEGGIVRAILVREGEMVREGDVLLRIDPTLAGSSLGEAREKILGLTALVARLEAEVEDRPLTFPQTVLDARPDLAQHQRDHFEARRRELEAAIGTFNLQETQRNQEILETRSKIATLQRSYTLSKEELEMVRGLERSRAASRSELIVIEGKVNDIDGALKAAELALPRLEAASREIAYILLGTLGAKFGDIVAYWVGSSSGSAQKSAALEKAVVAGGGR